MFPIAPCGRSPLYYRYQPLVLSLASSKDKNQLSLRHSSRSRALKASAIAMSVDWSGWLKLNSISPLTVEISEVDQPTRNWHFERSIGTVQRASASANSLATVRAGGTRPPKESPRCVSRGLATSSFGWGGAYAGYTARVNLNTKVLDFVQLGGPKLTECSTTFELEIAL